MKFIDHVFYTPIKSLTDGMRTGIKFGERMGGDGAGIACGLAGAVAGAILGGAKLISPIELTQTLVRSDEEIEQRGGDLFKDL